MPQFRNSLVCPRCGQGTFALTAVSTEYDGHRSDEVKELKDLRVEEEQYFDLIITCTACGYLHTLEQVGKPEPPDWGRGEDI